NCFHDQIGAETFGVFTNRFDWILILGVDGMGSTEGLGLFQFGVVNIDGDDRCGTCQLSTLNGSHANTTATDHGHSFAALEFTGVNGGTNAGHDTAAQETNCSVLVVFEFGFYLGALSGSDQGFLRK